LSLNTFNSLGIRSNVCSCLINYGIRTLLKFIITSLSNKSQIHSQGQFEDVHTILVISKNNKNQLKD